MSSTFHRIIRRRGFTILELMAVVGIIGIISAIAIPVFMLLKRMNWPKRSDPQLS